MLTMDEARARVAKGAARLDQVEPGWASRVDIGTLDISAYTRCVLGQLFGGYSRGLDRAELFDSGRNYGFEVVDYDKHESAAPAYRLLQEAWIEAIADRLHPVENVDAGTSQPVEAPVEAVHAA